MSRVTASLAGLPFELVTKIFESALEEECRDHCNWNLKPFVLPPAGFSGSSLLSPIHISSRLRRVMLGHPPIFRLLARKILTSLAFRKHTHSVNLLYLCTEHTSDSLHHFDFERFNETGSTCPLRIKDLVGIASLSAASIVTLRLPAFPKVGLPSCDCSLCGHSPLEFVADLWRYTLELLQKAKSLQRLEFDLPTQVDAFEHAPPFEETRPTDLRFKVSPGVQISEKLIDSMTQLSRSLQQLCIWVPGDATSEVMRSIRLLTLVCLAATSTLRSLILLGEIDEIVVARLFQHDWPRLEELSLGLDDPRTLLPLPSKKRHLASLRDVEIPAWTLAYFEAPNMERAVLTLGDAEDEALVVQTLTSWVSLAVLVLHSELEDRNEASYMLRGILRSLTPAGEERDKYACPALSALGISLRRCSFDDWIDQDEDDVPPQPDDPNSWYTAQYLRQAPLIGFDLYSLDKERRELFYDDKTYPSKSPWARDGVSDCEPLEVIRLLDCLVDPMAWRMLVQDKQSDEKRRCWPDPSEVHRRALLDDSKGLLADLPNAFWRLNGP